MGAGEQALELLMQKLQLKMSVCDGERGEPRTRHACKPEALVWVRASTARHHALGLSQSGRPHLGALSRAPAIG